MPLRHVDISSAFTAQKYNHDKPVFVKETARFDGSFTNPNCTFGKFILILYGSNTASQIYFAGLQVHLKNGYTALQADPCIFTKNDAKGTKTAGITTEDLLITAPTEHLIEELTTMLKSTQSGTSALLKHI